MAYDPFVLETGLLGNCDVTIRDTVFTHRADSWDAGQKLECHHTFLVEGEDGGEVVQYFSCGDGWESNDEGRTAVREDGKDRNFHANTKIGEFWGSLVELMGKDTKADKAIRARVADFPLGPRDAEFWKGLQLHIDREKRKGGGEIQDYEVLVVTGFNGIEGSTGGKATGAAKKATGAAKKAAGKTAAAAKKDGGLTDAIRKQLDDLADASESHDAFMEAAMAQVAEASSDDEIKAAIADDGEGSIWADAVARYEASVAGE